MNTLHYFSHACLIFIFDKHNEKTNKEKITTMVQKQ